MSPSATVIPRCPPKAISHRTKLDKTPISISTWTCRRVSPSELELAVLPEEDLLVSPAVGAASAGHRGNKGGGCQSQASQHVHLHFSQVSLPKPTGLQHPRHSELPAPPPGLDSQTIRLQSQRFCSNSPQQLALSSFTELLDGRETWQQRKDMRKSWRNLFSLVHSLLFTLNLLALSPGLWFYPWLKSIWFYSSRR